MPHRASPGKGRDSGKLIAVRPVDLETTWNWEESSLNRPTSTKVKNKIVIVEMNKQMHTRENVEAAKRKRKRSKENTATKRENRQNLLSH